MSLGNTDRKTIAEALEAAGIDSARRAESLSMEEFAKLSDSLREAGIC
jgi:16S rRNA A1518/A1519 N6-dimethyltransferase RsmA/KsgA/DIM1 with predicted DNA glycosylase/AP lyase activity